MWVGAQNPLKQRHDIIKPANSASITKPPTVLTYIGVNDIFYIPVS